MGKKLIGIAVIAIMLFGVFGLSGCSPKIIYADYEGDYGDYEPLQLVMNAGETQTIEASHFRGLDLDFEKFELLIPKENNGSVVTIEGKTITAANNGFVEVYAYLFERISDNGGKYQYAYSVAVAHIYVINEAEMVPITTVQELADINKDLNGKYILKADIYLSALGEWTPIGKDGDYINNQPPSTMFTGMLVNLEGYTIKNLTITTSETTKNAGLFGYIGERAFINGIVLEDIFIDVSDYDGEVIGSPKVGGIAGITNRNAMIINCSVNGILIGGGNATGGVVGSNLNSFIKNCNFLGEIEGPKFYNDHYAGAGGITGMHFSVYDGDIDGCHVQANIRGNAAYAGGIIGLNQHIGIMANCFFTGMLNGRQTDEMIGFDNWKN